MLNTIKAWHNRMYSDNIVIPYNDGYYKLSQNEKLIFGVKNKNSDRYLIYKVLTNSDYHKEMKSYFLYITTKEMNIPEGRYIYDIVLQQSDGQRIPIIRPSVFRVLPSVVGSEETSTDEIIYGGDDITSTTTKWNRL